MRCRRFVSLVCAALFACAALSALAAEPGAPPEKGQAQAILDATGVKGGVIIHVGCGDGRLTAALHANDSYVVQGLDADAKNVDAARKNIQTLSLYGKVTAEPWSGKQLPYIENFANLVVVEDANAVPIDEAMRVLAPNGVAYVKSGGPSAPSTGSGLAGSGQGQWTKAVKPRPQDIDEWTHYLHDPSNNAVAHDKEIAPPTRLQWIEGPRTSRHHDHMSAISAMVSANGRNFYIFDESPRESILIPSEFRLVARDAFNGAELWERPIGPWETQLLPLKSGPYMLTRRLVAAGDRVYATLALDAPLTAIDAATGQTVLTYEGTAATEEIILLDGTLYLIVADPAQVHGNPDNRPLKTLTEAVSLKSDPSWGASPRAVMAVDAATGAIKWRATSPVVPMTLAADSQGVYFHDGGKIICLDPATGQLRWQSPPIPVRESMFSKDSTTLVVKDGVVLLAGGEISQVAAKSQDGAKRQAVPRRAGAAKSATATKSKGAAKSAGPAKLAEAAKTPEDAEAADAAEAVDGGAAAKRGLGRQTGLCAVSAADGSLLWSASEPYTWGGALMDVLVTDGLVWSGDVASGSNSGTMIGRDPRTGEIKKQFPPDVDIFWFHHRCYRAKATDNFLLYSRTGIEFVDPEEEHWITNHWVRGGCLYGIMPCNGLVYNPPHPCACYSETKLYGFNAVAPPSKTWTPPREVPDDGRLQSAPAAAQIENPKPQIENPSDWPTYRHDAARSGATAAAVPTAGLKRNWQTELGGRLTPMTVAGGKVFVSSIDTHTVHALDEKTGKALWSFTAGGRVDSPPTIWRGRALFGSTDGHVYCLNAADGQLLWKFRAAPEERFLGAYDQIESVWPVPGSVLIQNDPSAGSGQASLYCVAGRSMFLDGGLRMLRLDPATGRKMSETIMDQNDPATGQNLQSHVVGLNMPVALPDILSSDGRYVYMRSLPFTLDGQRKFVDYVDVKDQQGDDRHLFSPTGFLDDTMWHRSYWVWGRAWASGAGGYHKAGTVTPAGRVLVFDDANVYGYGRLPQYYKWTTPMEFRVFAMNKDAQPAPAAKERPKAGEPIRSELSKKEKKAEKNAGPGPSGPAAEWSAEAPVQVCAATLAEKTLFLAGPPDVVDEELAARSFGDPDTQKRLAEQEAAFEGKRGAILLAVSAAEGKPLASYRLDSTPIFDGMAAANGRLYVTTMDGKALCLGAGEGQPLQLAPDATAAGKK
ncbi:MAG: PQQ-binding-like beta-propeller repeat protein [Candidatus Sumerlaeota bacterium]|nr:PQQ-binding-like beta-propeller repeat protein [Candidatus Sumerlaeota bacterium]